jgi:predicted transcriptional regulator
MFIPHKYIKDLSETDFSPIRTILPDANIVQAVWLMICSPYKVLIVSNRKDEIVGILSWNDIQRFAKHPIGENVNADDVKNILKRPTTKVMEIMTKDVIYLDYSEDSIGQVIDLLVNRHYKGGYRAHTPILVSQVLVLGHPKEDRKTKYCIAYHNILKNIHGADTTKISDIINPTFEYIEDKTSVQIAYHKMQVLYERQLLVVSFENHRLVPIGLITDGDVISAGHHHNIENIEVEELTVNFPPVKVYEDDTIKKIIDVYCGYSQKYKIYPILNTSNNLVGCVHYQDILRAAILK